MSAKHQTPEYQRNARTLRKRWRPAHREGTLVCWRCRRLIAPSQPYDVGHLPGAGGSAESDLAPEHRHATLWCVGNRAAGAKLGAAITNARHTPTIPTKNATTWRL